MSASVAANKRSKYLIVINNLSFFYSHFWNLAIAIRNAGWDVYIAGNENASSAKILDSGMTYISLPPVGGTRSPVGAINYFVSLTRELRRLKADVSHFIYLENVLFGGMAARLLGLPAIIGAVTGLGTLFAEDRLSYKVIRRMVVAGIRWGYRSRRAVLAFENLDDRSYFVDGKAIDESKTAIIPGAGVAQDELLPRLTQNERPMVFFASRMVRSKGMLELVKALQELYERGLLFDLWLAGDVDKNNPTSLQPDEIREFEKLPFVKYLGHRSDVAQLMQSADIFCLPTYYREGLPRVIIEACAAGKPVVTTDMPGCRDIIHNTVNGFLVKPRDHDDLVRALETLLSQPELRISMGKEARRIFEEGYTLDSFMRAFNRCYQTLGVALVLDTKSS